MLSHDEDMAQMNIRRRPLVASGMALLAAPGALIARTPGKTPRIGYLSMRSGPENQDEAFRQGLRERGYVEGKNISVEYRWADSKPERVPALAGEMVRLKVDVLVCAGGGTALILAVKKAVKTIPVVFQTGGDPVSAGFVASLDRPGGNLTGVTALTSDLTEKRLELLKQAVPGVSRVAVLVNPTSTDAAALKGLEAAARTLKVKLLVLEARDPQAIDGAFAAMKSERPDALLVANSVMFFAQRKQIVGLAAQSRLPGIFEGREFAEAGGLLSYGASLADNYRRLASYVDRILKGAKPADLPVEQPTRFELVINLKAAKALGITIPQSLLLRADEVIQ